MRSTRQIRLRTGFASSVLALLAVFALAACSSGSDDTPVPPTPQPTVAATATIAPEPTATTAPAPTATSPTAAAATPAPTATATPDPFVVLTLLVTGEIDPNAYPKVEPGEATLLDRAFEGAPPQVPHRASNMVIVPDRNACLECHETGKTVNGSIAVQVPISHYTDFTTGSISGQLYPGRYVCTSCHVPQVVDDPPYAGE